jgi:hypothetical protein
MASEVEDTSQRDSNDLPAVLPFSYDDAEIYTEAPAAEFKIGRATVMFLVMNRMIGDCLCKQERSDANLAQDPGFLQTQALCSEVRGLLERL